MSKKRTKKQADRAVPAIRAPKRTDAEKVALTHSVAASTQASPHWSAAVDVQKAVLALGKHSDSIAAKVATITGLANQLLDARRSITLDRRDWQVALNQVLGAVEVFAAGSGDVVKELGFETLAAPTFSAQPAPSDLSVTHGAAHGEVVALWKKGSAKHGFVVQHAPDPANTATYSAIVPSTRAKCTFVGLPTASIVFVRVAAVDPRSPTAQSPWTDWAHGTVP